jgi:hypothetical protein
VAWARIHDGAMSHPKVITLSDKAFRLWVWGLSYCQMHLTDGAIPAAAIPPPPRTATLLTLAHLWDAREAGGYVVHDYLDWNDSKATVTTKRREAKERMANVRQRGSRELLRGVGSSGLEHLREKGSGEKPTARSKRPVYTSDRFAVFEWQLDELSKVLGNHFENFDLHGFFDILTQQSRSDGLVIPKADVWLWLQAQVITEAQRRGLPMANVAAANSRRTADVKTYAELHQEDYKKHTT